MYRLARRQAVIGISAADYKRLVVGSHKDYAVVVEFTAGPSMQCPICRIVESYYRDLAGVVRTAMAADETITIPIFFVEMVFSHDIQEIFQKHALQGVPVVAYFGPRVRAKRIDYNLTDDMLLGRAHMTRGVPGMLDWLNAKHSTKIVYLPPFYVTHATKLLLLAVIAVICCLAALNPAAWSARLYDRETWLRLSFYIYFVVVCGGVYVAITGSPMIGGNPHTGELALLSRSSMQMYGTEGLLCAACVVTCFLCLLWANTRLPLVPDAQQRVVAYTGMTVFVIAFNAWRLLYRVKQPWYMSY
eukprot:TRINITY_DN487_c0_g1_i1.p1 TRINITY_DN487_c0_g1~~TRINITY_DN487_c0_g1_i1.p1  ORF type:complete len:302 (+),score=16.77 TRINITY_DN487_c0_g1_i1:229-1134(+)